MASTITNLINTIDTGFPVAGQDNDSQGFRNNFSIIQQSLLATQGEIDNIGNVISTLGGTAYTTATHIHALKDVKIGTTSSVLLSVNDSGGIVAASNSSSVVLVGVTESVQSQVAFALTDSPTDTTATMFALQSVNNISLGATVSIANTQYTVSQVDPATNYITVSQPFPVGSFAVGDTLTFNNPYVAPTGNLYIDGDISVTGNITAFAGSPSDERLKENITTVTNALSMVKSMRGVFYDWTDVYLETIHFSPLFPKHDVGVIAQEMETVLPEVVAVKPNGSLTVKYEKIVGVLIEAIKELSTKVDTLQAQVDALTTSTNV
jgi:hypothetical protein